MEQYMQAGEEVAREAAARRVRYAPALEARGEREVLSDDGAHPSAVGHEIIAEELGPALAEALGCADAASKLAG
jgi:lysophospholipase L1-like esterase